MIFFYIAAFFYLNYYVRYLIVNTLAIILNSSANRTIMNSMNSTKSGQYASPKFTLKTSPNNSMVDAGLDMAIRRSNVKHFIKKGIGAGNEGTTVQLQDNLGIEEHLLSLKKSCSDLSREIKTRELESFKFKDEISFTYEKNKKIKEDRQKLEEKIADLQKNLDKVNAKRQAALHSSKTYEHILQRMKKDDVYYQLCKNELERKLKTLQKSFGLVQTKHYNISEFEKQAEAGLKDANDELSEQNLIRKNNFNSVEHQTHVKIEKQKKLKERQKQTEQIQELAADDIHDADLIKLKKFLTVEIFLRELLKFKISKLKEYYEPYQQAFFQIKSNTNVRDASSLKTEFFNFENIYNQKTVWVKHLEGQIAEAEEQRKKLQQRVMQIKIAQMEDIEKMEENQNVSPLENKKALMEKSLQHQLVWQRIQAWIAIQAKRLKLQGNPNTSVLFKQILGKLKPKPQQQKQRILPTIPPQEQEQVKIN